MHFILGLGSEFTQKSYFKLQQKPVRFILVLRRMFELQQEPMRFIPVTQHRLREIQMKMNLLLMVCLIFPFFFFFLRSMASSY